MLHPVGVKLFDVKAQLGVLKISAYEHDHDDWNKIFKEKNIAIAMSIRIMTKLVSGIEVIMVMVTESFLNNRFIRL